jgi:soluble lytic murein transglycosylase-like protein
MPACAACDADDGATCAHVAAELHLYDAPSASRTIPSVAPFAAAASVGATPAHLAPVPVPARLAPAPATFTPAQRRVLALAPSVLAVARDYDIAPLLLHAMAEVESRHNPGARSPAGALGVLQVLPDTARRFGVAAPGAALLDADTNLAAGAAYLKSLQARYGDDLPLVLAAYNAGEGAVDRHGRRVPPYAETRRYVQQVLAVYGTLRTAFAGAPLAEAR